jgi:hypothetical protein
MMLDFKDGPATVGLFKIVLRQHQVDLRCSSHLSVQGALPVLDAVADNRDMKLPGFSKGKDRFDSRIEISNLKLNDIEYSSIQHQTREFESEAGKHLQNLRSAGR